MLQLSLRIEQSAEASVALGLAFVSTRRWKEAERIYASALISPPMLPEDWSLNGWAAVHAHLGLARVYYHEDRIQKARGAYTKFMNWFSDPGLWHDLDETEDLWGETLATRWQMIADVPWK